MRNAGQRSAQSPHRAPVDRLLRAFLHLCGALPRENAIHEALTDWEMLLPCLRRHRLRPLAYWVARSLQTEMPGWVHRELESAYYGAAVRYETLRSSLGQIAGACSTLRGPLIVLKGLALAERLYPGPACRPMEDLDLLVREEELPAASRLLISLGYTDRSFGAEDFRNPDTGIVVDLHAELLNTTHLPSRRMAWRPDLDRWRERAIPFSLTPPIFRLHPRDDLVYLCHHAWLHHGLRKPLALLDICLLFADTEAHGDADLLHRPNPDSARRALWYGLLACGHRFGLPIPDAVRQSLPPNTVGSFERCVHALAIRGRLPETARFVYLWLALPPRYRLRMLYQGLSSRWTAGG